MENWACGTPCAGKTKGSAQGGWNRHKAEESGLCEDEEPANTANGGEASKDEGTALDGHGGVQVLMSSWDMASCLKLLTLASKPS